MAVEHSEHEHDDPHGLPRHDIKEQFGPGAVALCYILAFLALVGGLAAGLAFVE